MVLIDYRDFASSFVYFYNKKIGTLEAGLFSTMYQIYATKRLVKKVEATYIISTLNATKTINNVVVTGDGTLVRRSLAIQKYTLLEGVSVSHKGQQTDSGTQRSNILHLHWLWVAVAPTQ